MKKMLSLLLALALLLPLFTVLPACAETPNAKTRVQFNMRTEPNDQAPRRRNVPTGASIEVLAYSEDWCKVSYMSATGYARTSWLRISEDVIAKLPPLGDVPSTLGATATNLAATDGSNAMTFTGGGTETGAKPITITFNGKEYELQYLAMNRIACSIRREPNDKSGKVKELKKGSDLRVFDNNYDDEWTVVQSMDGRYTGYMKKKYLFHYHSMDLFRWPIPDWEVNQPTGYIIMNREMHIDEGKGSYGGNDLKIGDILWVRLQEDGNYQVQVRRSFIDIPADAGEYYPVTPWREAKKGDIIGGYTQYFGQKQGTGYKNRQKNIQLAMSRMDQTEIASGAEYSFLTNIGPVTKKGGYLIAGIAGGPGLGYGGGTCHTSTLMYEAVLTLPFFVTEREPHTDEGATYAPLEFDATVGAYSDMRFVNTLPYGVKLLAYMDKPAGVITVRFEVTEDVDPEILATWDGSKINTAAFKYRH